jgi:hypothetical protein
MKKLRKETSTTEKPSLSSEPIRRLFVSDLQDVVGGVGEGELGSKRPLPH